MGFSRQEYWSGLPFPSPVDLPSPGIEPRSPALTGGFFTVGATWEGPFVISFVMYCNVNLCSVISYTPLEECSKTIRQLKVEYTNQRGKKLVSSVT